MKLKNRIKSLFKDTRFKRKFKKRLEVAPSGLDLDENLYAFRYLCHQVEKAIKNDFNSKNIRGKAKYEKAKQISAVLNKSSYRNLADFKWGLEILSSYEDWLKGNYVHEVNYSVDKPPIKSNFSDVVFDRRSVRYWTREKVPKKMINDLLEHAVMSPTSCNRQAFRISIVNNTCASITTNYPGDTTNRSMISRAPHMVYISIDRRLYPEVYAPAIDAGIICQTLLLSMESFGLGGCPMYHSEAYNQKYLRKVLGLNKNQFIYVGIPFGFPAEKPDTPVRVPIDMAANLKSFDMTEVSRNC